MRLLPTQDQILRYAQPLVFARRRLNLFLLAVITVVLGYQAVQIGIDAGFQKSIPLEHPYMQTFQKYKDAFGGANLVSVALIQKDGEIYNEEFLSTLKQVTDAVFFLTGVDRSRVTSLFTPGVRYLEITEDGFSGGDVIPRDYAPGEQMFRQIKVNVGKANIIGRLVSNDESGAMVIAELLEFHPVTGEKLDYVRVSEELEKIRDKFETENIEIHIIGFPMIVGDVVDASLEVVSFFAIALVMMLVLVWLFCASFKLALLPLGCTLVAVIWEFGLLKTLGFGLDPFAILVPFLVLAIGVSHGVQMINSWGSEVAVSGHGGYDAAVETFRKLAVPGTTALLTDVIGFATIAFINIDIIQEMAINATLGMAAIIVTNKVLMPILLTYLKLGDIEAFNARQQRRKDLGDRIWNGISVLTQRRAAAVVIVLCGVMLGWSVYKYHDLKIGDLQTGVPELRPNSVYNQDSRAIAGNFAIGVDLLKVIAETEPEACIDFEVMERIDRYTWHMENTRGVQSARSLAHIVRFINVGWNEGDIHWRTLPRNKYLIAQSIGPIPTSSGLKSADCSKMPIFIFTTDHRAETIENIIQATKDFNAEYGGDKLQFALATGNVGVMAATNEVIERMELPILLGVYAALIVFIWLSFRTFASVICIVFPLALVSMLTYAFMAVAGVGLKAATLPVVALGVGWGVDDSIYLWSVLGPRLKSGESLFDAWFHTLQRTGRAVIFTSIAVLVAVSTWLFSGLQFQADMGLLMVFMFTANLFGAILVLPAMAHFFVRRPRSED